MNKPHFDPIVNSAPYAAMQGMARQWDQFKDHLPNLHELGLHTLTSGTKFNSSQSQPLGKAMEQGG